MPCKTLAICKKILKTNFFVLLNFKLILTLAFGRSRFAFIGQLVHGSTQFGVSDMPIISPKLVCLVYFSSFSLPSILPLCELWAVWNDLYSFLTPIFEGFWNEIMTFGNNILNGAICHKTGLEILVLLHYMYSYCISKSSICSLRWNLHTFKVSAHVLSYLPVSYAESCQRSVKPRSQRK